MVFKGCSMKDIPYFFVSACHPDALHIVPLDTEMQA